MRLGIAQASLALRSAFTAFSECKMRLGIAQASLALHSAFTAFVITIFQENYPVKWQR